MQSQATIIKNISSERFKPYLEMAEGSISSAIKLYEFNIKISESFYSSLHNVEIFLRNNFHSAMMEIYGEKWFLNRNLLAGTSGREFVNIVKVDDIIAKLKTSNTSDVISNLSFGFWVSLLYPNYEINIWRPALRKIFPSEQKITRKEIHQKLEIIKLTRNRTAHHEFILNHDLEFYHKVIYEILEYLSPELVKWTSSLDKFLEVSRVYEDFLVKSNIGRRNLKHKKT